MYEVIEDDMFTEAYIYPSDDTAVYVDTLNWRNKFFFLASMKDEQHWNIYVQMLGTEEECKEHVVKICLMDEEGRKRVCLTDNPFPITERGDNVNKLQGLLVSQKMVEKKIEHQPAWKD